MQRLTIPIALLAAVLMSGPAAGESWDCGQSTAYSPRFIIETDLCDSARTAIAAESIVVDTIWSPSSIKKHPLGQRVALLSLPIARAFAQRFYIEAVDRSSGIGVMAGVTADPGRMAAVTGTVANVEGEIVLLPGLPEDVTLGELGDAPKPLGMSSTALRLGIGADPTGILARVWGKAVSVPQGETYYLVSDGGPSTGSGCTFTVLPEGVPRPDEGADVILTGIPGVATVGGQQVRVFRVNAQ